VAVLEKTIEDLLRTIDSMQKRMDSHSKKQDDILEKIGSMEKEVLKQMGVMGASIGSLASDVKNLNNLLSITDTGIVLKRQK
jgi:septation ring formation regulator EzrA